MNMLFLVMEKKQVSGLEGSQMHLTPLWLNRGYNERVKKKRKKELRL